MKSIIKKSNANNKRPKKRVTFKDHKRRHNKKQTKKIQWGGDITEEEIKDLEDKYNKNKMWKMYYDAKENNNEAEKRLQLLDLDTNLSNGIQEINKAIEDNLNSLFSKRLTDLKFSLDSEFNTVHPMLNVAYSDGQQQTQDYQEPQMQDQTQPPGAFSGLEPETNSFEDSIIPSDTFPRVETDAFDSNSVTNNNSDVIDKPIVKDLTLISEQSLSFEDFNAVVKAIETQTENIICLLLLVLEKKNNENNNEEISKVIQEIKSKISGNYGCKERDDMYKKMNDAMIILGNSSAHNLDKLLSKIMSQTINYIDFYVSIVTKFNERNENMNKEIQNEYIQKLNELKQQLVDLTKKVPDIQIDETSSEQSDKLSTVETFIDTLLLAFTSSQILVGGLKRKKKTKKRNRRLYKRRQTKRNKGHARYRK